MPRKITKTVYSFEELIEESKKEDSEISSSTVEKVRYQLQELATEGEWYDGTKMEWDDTLEQMGFIDPDISFSGFASQGDGASFTSRIDMHTLLTFMTTKIEPNEAIAPSERTGEEEEDFLPYVVHRLNGNYGYDQKWLPLLDQIEHLGGKVIRIDSHYCHENTCDVEIEAYSGFPEELLPLVNEFEKEVEELRTNLCDLIYKDLEKNYDDITSDEYLIDYDEANDYQWDSSGNREE